MNWVITLAKARAWSIDLVLPQFVLLDNSAQVFQLVFVDLQIGDRSLQGVPVYSKTITRFSAGAAGVPATAADSDPVQRQLRE